MIVSVIVDSNTSWILPYAQKLVEHLTSRNYDARFCKNHDEISDGDIAFYLGCVKITPVQILAKNKHNLVVHESDLPKGKGFSPLTWQILEGKNRIPIVLFEAVESVDAGLVYIKDEIVFNGDELIEEMRDKQGKMTLELCVKFVEKYPGIVACAVSQEGDETFYKRRKPQDSKLDPGKTIADQFNLLRVVDNERYPAFFEINGCKYSLKIEKVLE